MFWGISDSWVPAYLLNHSHLFFHGAHRIYFLLCWNPVVLRGGSWFWCFIKYLKYRRHTFLCFTSSCHCDCHSTTTITSVFPRRHFRGGGTRKVFKFHWHFIWVLWFWLLAHEYWNDRMWYTCFFFPSSRTPSPRSLSRSSIPCIILKFSVSVFIQFYF